MSSDVDKAQIKLEGRCTECFMPIHEHSGDCTQNPLYDSTVKLRHISKHIDDLIQTLSETLEANNDKLDEIEQLLEKIKLKQGNN